MFRRRPLHEKVVQRRQHGRCAQNQCEEAVQRAGQELRMLADGFPSQASTEHHSSDPARVASAYQRKSMRRIPTGMPIKCRITGSSREKNTPADS